MSKPYGVAQSRTEAILQNMLGESYDLEVPQSREELLLQLLLGEFEAIKGSEQSDASTGIVSATLESGKIYHFTGEITELTVTLEETEGVAHYHFDFLSGSTATVLNLPASVIMTDGFEVEANKRYEIDILDSYGAAQEWSLS